MRDGRRCRRAPGPGRAARHVATGPARGSPGPHHRPGRSSCRSGRTGRRRSVLGGRCAGALAPSMHAHPYFRGSRWGRDCECPAPQPRSPRRRDPHRQPALPALAAPGDRRDHAGVRGRRPGVGRRVVRRPRRRSGVLRRPRGRDGVVRPPRGASGHGLDRRDAPRRWRVPRARDVRHRRCHELAPVPPVPPADRRFAARLVPGRAPRRGVGHDPARRAGAGTGVRPHPRRRRRGWPGRDPGRRRRRVRAVGLRPRGVALPRPHRARASPAPSRPRGPGPDGHPARGRGRPDPPGVDRARRPRRPLRLLPGPRARHRRRRPRRPRQPWRRRGDPPEPARRPGGRAGVGDGRAARPAAPRPGQRPDPRCR